MDKYVGKAIPCGRLRASEVNSVSEFKFNLNTMGWWCRLMEVVGEYSSAGDRGC